MYVRVDASPSDTNWMSHGRAAASIEFAYVDAPADVGNMLLLALHTGSIHT